MNEEINKSGELYKAFAAAQAEFSNPIKNRKNPAFRSDYADLQSCLDACKPALNRHGIAITQRVQSDEHSVSVETVLIHGSGETLHSGFLCVPYAAGKGAPAQALGSALTYAKRYSLCSFLGLAADDDDDGNAAGVGQQAQHYFVLTQEMVDTAKSFAGQGTEAYQQWFMAQSADVRRALSAQGLHAKLKAFAAEVS